MKNAIASLNTNPTNAMRQQRLALIQKPGHRFAKMFLLLDLRHGIHAVHWSEEEATAGAFRVFE